MGKRYDKDPLYKAAVDASEAGRHLESIESWKMLTERDPQNPFFLCCLGHEYLDVNRFANAIEAFRSSLLLDDKCGLTWNGLGIAYKELGQYEHARDAFETAARFDPKAYNYVQLAAVLVKLGRYDDAIERCHEALEVDPVFEEAYLNIALAYREKQMYPEAIENLNNAIELDPGYSSAYAALGSVYELMGDRELTKIYYGKAREMSDQTFET